MIEEEEDICGLCGEPGADKMAHPCHWPGESIPGTPYVHAACEEEECRRAHAALTPEQIATVIRSISLTVDHVTAVTDMIARR